MIEQDYQLGALLFRKGRLAQPVIRSKPLPVEKAIREWQSTYGLEVTGTSNPETWKEALAQGVTETGYPSSPSRNPLSFKEKTAILGSFAYKANPVPGNPENITIQGSWVKDNLATVSLPLKGVKGFPQSGKVQCHKAIADRMVSLFDAWAHEDLLGCILTWDGLWAPRFSRGSTVNLSSHCLPASEMVWTTQGPVSIADLRGYTGQVWSYQQGHMVPGNVTAFFNNGRKPLLRVRAVGHELTCTPNHPILVLRKHTLPKDEWIQHPKGRGQQRATYWTEMVRAEKLKPGDRVVAARHVPSVSGGQSVSGDWAEILGLFLGDGCLHHRNGSPAHVSFVFPVGDRVREHVISILTRYFGEVPKQSANALMFYRQSVWERFIPYDRKAQSKAIPSEVWGWDAESKKRLLLGLVYSDGTVSATRSSSGGGTSCRYIFKLSSKKLIEDIRMLMSCLSFRVGRIGYTESEERTIQGVRTVSGPSWTVGGTDVCRALNPVADTLYLKRVESASLHKQGNSPCWGYEQVGSDFTHHRVQGVDFVGDGEVFDIEVDEYHNFLAGGVVVSNSWGSAFDINAWWNPLGSKGAPLGAEGCLYPLIPLAEEHGFYCGAFGWGTGRYDTQHFELGA